MRANAILQEKSKSVPWSDPAEAPSLILDFQYGLNENQTPGIQECTEGYNFELAVNDSTMRNRQPFNIMGTATNGKAITGILQLIKRDNTETTLVCATDTVYQWDGASTFSSKGSVTGTALLRGAYWALGDYLVITDVNLNNVVKTWDGTTFTSMTTALAGPLKAKYGIVHENRVWLFNINYNGTSYPHMILACKFEDPTNWDTASRGGPSTVGGGTFATGLEAFYLLVPDLKAINGVCLYQNTLVISTDKGRLWELTGSSAKDFQFTDFYDTSPSIGSESIASIGNDAVFMREGGRIAVLSSTQNFGNVFTSDLSYWIPNSVKNLTGTNQIVYDVMNQKVYFFVTDKVLVFYKNLLAGDKTNIGAKGSPWSVYTTQHPSGFNTSAAVYARSPGKTTYTVIWGDSSGNLFDMNGGDVPGLTGDAGSYSITVYRKSIHLDGAIINPWPWTVENMVGRIVYRRLTQTSLSLQVDWDDEYNSTISSVNLKGTLSSDTGNFFGGAGYFGGAFYFGGGSAAMGRKSSINFEVGGKGPGMYAYLTANVDGKIEVSQIVFD